MRRTEATTDPLADIIRILEGVQDELLIDINGLADSAAQDIYNRIWLPYTRRLLMALSDSIRAKLEKALTAARAERDLKASLRTTIAGLQAAGQDLQKQITDMQNTPGPWADEDVATISNALDEIVTNLDPDAVVAAVVENTPAAAGDGTGTGG